MNRRFHSPLNLARVRLESNQLVAAYSGPRLPVVRSFIHPAEHSGIEPRPGFPGPSVFETASAPCGIMFQCRPVSLFTYEDDFSPCWESNPDLPD